jgi:hypothetical protein
LYDSVVMYLLSLVSYSNGALLSCDGRLLPHQYPWLNIPEKSVKMLDPKERRMVQ